MLLQQINSVNSIYTSGLLGLMSTFGNMSCIWTHEQFSTPTSPIHNKEYT